jgi:TolB-like protein/DNA-binding winged helix-turn-helix (wHTH) protein/Tfp pilus assembly protein PilF
LTISTAQLWRFGPFEFDERTGELRRGSFPIKLQEQPARVLALLLLNKGELVTREQLRGHLWPDDTFVDFEHSLNTAIKKLREALEDSAERPNYIETLPRRGYRFIAAVSFGPAPAQEQTAAAEVTTAVPSRRKARGFWYGAAAVGIIVALLFGLKFGRQLLFGPAPSPRIQSLAVLPLANLSGDSSQDYFADGMTDELTTDLAKISGLKVVSSTSAMQYRGTHPSLKRIAQDLNVDAVIEGSVVRAGDRVRITVQLIDARNDQHLWAENYERDFRDILSVQNTVALEIAGQVRANLTSQERKAFDVRRTVVPEAYDAYLRGRNELGKQRQGALRKGLEYFQQAITLDRLYAPAYAGLADSYSLLVNYSALPPREAFPLARSAALKALELDPALAEAHTSLAYVKHHFDWDWVGAEAEYKQSIQLDPNNAITHLRYAELLSNVARHDEAIREVRRAHELAPLSLVIQANVGADLYYARRYDEAITELQKVLAADPHRVWARIYLAMCYEQKRLYTEALVEMEKVRTEFNGQAGSGEAHLYASMGRIQDARRLLKDLEQPAPDGAQDWFFIAAIYAQLGEKDQAFNWLEQAHENRDFFLTYLKVFPQMDPLRSDPRYTSMVRRMGLP